VAVDEHQAPRTGTAFFTGFERYDGASPRISTGFQVVDLSAHAPEIDARRGRLYAIAYVATGYQVEERDGEVSNIPKPYDEGEVVVEALDASRNAMGARYSKRRDTLSWFPFAGAFDLPTGTRALDMGQRRSYTVFKQAAR
jgi:hypothetical protein